MGGGLEASEASTSKGKGQKIFNCGEDAAFFTSWKNVNPNRRFYRCYKGKHDCNFFSWHDPQVVDHEEKAIKGLLKRINVLETKEKLYRAALSYIVATTLMLGFVVLKTL